MGGEQAANVLRTVKVQQLAEKGKKMSDAEQKEFMRPILEKYEQEGSPYHSTARLWDDGIIDPRETRKVLALALATSRDAARRKLRASSFGVARM